MTVNPNWPQLGLQCAFNSGFADLVSPVWTDLTQRMWSFSCERGRQYELDENQAGTGAIVLADKDEVLNPANPAPGPPYAGNIVPYRQLMLQAQWPPAPVGGATNLLNAAAQSPGPYDPSFESYSAASAVSWLTAVGATTPVIGTTTPHAGTKDVTWTVANGTTVQGVSYQVPCIPGQQYTSSLYVRQSSASTQSLRVTDQNVAADNFGRTTASGWGTADYVGGAWTAAGGVAGNYSTTPGTGIPPIGTGYHANTTVNASRKTITGSVVDSTQLVLITVPAVAAGGEIIAGLISRYVDTSNYYTAEAWFGADATITVKIRKDVAGSFTNVGSTAVAPFTYAAGTQVWMRFATDGPALRVRVWLYGTAEPSTWLLDTTDTTFTAAGATGCRSTLSAANTNALPVTLGFSCYSVVGSVLGSTTTTTGAYVRLTVTWTATQPLHTIQLATSGTAVAGTVLLDDVQHEPGASASTTTTAGPVIYGVHSGYVERWPSAWNFNGMYGYAQLTTVDAFAALAARKLDAAYRAALLATRPDYYWPLSEPSGSVQFADATGNPQNPPMVFVSAKAGPGTLPVSGTTTVIPGDPGGTGVAFTVKDANNAGTIIGAGAAVPLSTVPIPVPATIGSSWAVSCSLWFTDQNQPGAGSYLLYIGTILPNGNLYLPILISVDSTGLIDLHFENSVGGTPYGFTTIVTPTPNVADGKPHLLCGVITQDATNTTATIYADGVSVATNTTATSGLGGVLGGQANTVTIGGLQTPTVFQSAAAIVNHVAIHNRALSPSEIGALYVAGSGYPGEGSGDRVARYLVEGSYRGASQVDTGQSVMGADVATQGTALLDAALAVATSESGNLWVAGTGAVTFTSRTRRYLTTTAKWAFGEQESPYLGDIAFDHDPQLVYNQVTVTNAGGGAAVFSDPASQTAYGTRSLSRDINVADNNEATDAANWIGHTHKDPHQRIAAVTIDPASNPALWPVAFGVEIGDRVTVKRRTPAFTMSADYFIEHIAHNQSPDKWTVTFEMSPAPLWPTPWILGDATFGVLDSTTVLGY